MKKEVKILLGVLGVLSLGGIAYYFLRPIKNQTSPQGKLDVNSLIRVPSADDTPDDIVGGTVRTYKDSKGNTYKYTWTSGNPMACGGDCGRYADQNGNLWDSEGNPAKPIGE